ncbi:MAG: glycosyltransferase [Cyanophyceae cyanobacterium]
MGIGQYIQRLLPPLVKELTTRNIDVRILASPNAFENTAALQDLSEIVDVLPPLDYLPAKRYFWCATRLARYSQQEALDVLLWLSNPIVLPWHPPSLAVIHDVNEWKAAEKYGNYLKTTLRSWIYLDASLQFARRIIAISQATERDLLHFRPSLAGSQKLVTILNGADSPLTTLPSIEINTPLAPFLLSVGRIDPLAKRLPEAVSLVQALRNSSGQAWELHLVGGMNDTTRSAGEAFLKSVEPLPWVIYHGYLEDQELAQWYRQATAVVFLSNDEGFGFPIAEAASLGRWVVVSQANQAGVEAGAGSIIPINPDDPQAAAATLLRQLQRQPAPVTSSTLPRWQMGAARYAEEVKALLKNRNSP